MEEEIRQLCGERGLTVDRVERRGVVLVIYPKEGSSLPTVETLNEIAEAVDVEGVRYTTLGLDKGQGLIEGQNG